MLGFPDSAGSHCRVGVQRVAYVRGRQRLLVDWLMPGFSDTVALRVIQEPEFGLAEQNVAGDPLVGEEGLQLVVHPHSYRGIVGRGRM